AGIVGVVFHHRGAPPVPQELTLAAPPKAKDLAAGYPRARWRLSPKLPSRVVASVEHILVAHRESHAAEAGMWADEAPVNRSPEEALQRALDLARRAQDQPSQFEELARAESDDRVTAPWGGAFGVTAATQLPEEIVDALDQLRAGDVSRVVETDWGFHVIKRLAVPPETWVAGRAIVVKYRGASGWPRQDRPLASHGRDEARAL